MSDTAIFVTLKAVDPGAVDGCFNRDALLAQLRFLETFVDVKSVEIYTPEKSELNDNEATPAALMIIQIDLAETEAAIALAQSEAFNKLFNSPNAYPFVVSSTTVELTETVHIPLNEQVNPQPRTAPLSYVVRYYGPVIDGAEFVHFYTNSHAPILSQFPELRNLLCYLPLGWQSRKEVPEGQLVIGNEVVFDDEQALLHALSTEVLTEAREDGKLFQSFGYSTHHVMRRHCVFSRVAGGSTDVQ